MSVFRMMPISLLRWLWWKKIRYFKQIIEYSARKKRANYINRESRQACTKEFK